MKVRAGLALLLLTAGIAVAYQVRARQQPATPASLIGYVPQDALLTIESPDFASLLHRWAKSAECKAWLSSDSYAVFQNSRLFGRLRDAQSSFASTAGFSAGVDLLKQVAGGESVFAWYDIGKLQFLYITRMSAAEADHSQLLQARGSFERRHAGNADFYLRTSGLRSPGGEASTVAFARVAGPSGDLVLLATREDLMASALNLIARSASAHSVGEEPWFRDVAAALPEEKPAPALHMVMNLDRVVPDPHFRSYWIQRNITWMRQFRAAASDLYVEEGRFREERVLLPRSAEAKPATLDLGPLAAIVPPSAGVYRAVATGDPAVAVAAIREKLWGDEDASASGIEAAPDPSLEAPQAGSASDLETRIDTVPVSGPAAATDGLRQVFQAAGVDAVLTVSSAQMAAEKDGVWIPIHSAVVLHAERQANAQSLASALLEAMRGSLTAGSIGIHFESTSLAGAAVQGLTGPRPLLFAIASTPAQGQLILFADDAALLAELLRRVAAGSGERTSTANTLIAGFDHAGQRAAYLRLTSLIDGADKQVRPGMAAGGQTVPAFFSRNVGSLSDSFAGFASEEVVERVVDGSLRQTVIYRWGAP